MAPRRRRFAFNILLRHPCMASPSNLIIAGVLITALALSTQSLRSQPPTQLDRDAILHHLNAVITWYHDATSKIKSVGLPSDAIHQDNARNLAAQAVRLAFQSARAEADILNPTDKTSDTNPPPSSGAQPTQQQNLAQTAAKIAVQIDDAQSKLDAVNKQIAAASKSKRQQSDLSPRASPSVCKPSCYRSPPTSSSSAATAFVSATASAWQASPAMSSISASFVST